MKQILYADDLVLIGESMEELRENFDDWREAFESKGVRVNLGKTKLMVSGIEKETFDSKIDPCVVCGTRVMSNSVLCTYSMWLQSTCNKYIELINKKRPRVHGLIESFPFLSIDRRLKKKIATVMYKFTYKLLPKIFENFFQVDRYSNRATISSSQIIPISCLTNIGQ